MALVIVTKQCYLLCESINFISVDDISNDNEDREFKLSSYKKNSKLKKKPKKDPSSVTYEITVDFVPAANGTGSNHNRGREIGTVTITVVGKDNCTALFNDMVKQIRDQMPDVLHLDKLVEEFLTDKTNGA